MKTKFLIILSLLLLTCHFSNAQKSIRNKRVGITFSSFGISEPIYFTDLDGQTDYSSKSFYSLGVNYIHPLTSWIDLETGVEYTRHNIRVKQILPPMNIPSYNNSFSIINIPITVRANLSQYFFVSGGLLLDLEAGSSSVLDRQTGVGAILGIGAQYEFNNGLGLFINPYSKAHTLIPFSSEEYHQRLIEAGVRVGLTYSFKTK